MLSRTKKECKTYKELEKAIRDIEWYGEYGGDFLVELLRYKMEEEKVTCTLLRSESNVPGRKS